jgi:DNA excision repair protein ERCC-4
MKILIDTREKLPFTFARYEVATDTASLPVGDYSLPGFEDYIAIERKSLDDLISCLMGENRKRFERELQRATAFDVFAIVVEANWTDVSRGHYRSQMKSQSALQSIITFQVRYRVPFVWAGNRDGAEYTTYWMLQKYLYEIEKRYQMAVSAIGDQTISR